MTLLIGILFGVTMLYNVWMVIWPAQQKVIGNARNVQAGGEADPDGRGRRAPARWLPVRTRSSRSRCSCSWSARRTSTPRSMATSRPAPGGAKWFVYFLIGLAVLVVLELNALGKISGRGNTGLNVIYETHKNAMYTGIGLIVGFYILAEILTARLRLAGLARRGGRRCGRGATVLVPKRGSPDLMRRTKRCMSCSHV